MEGKQNQSNFNFTNEMTKFQEFKKEASAAVADDIFSEVLGGDELLDSN